MRTLLARAPEEKGVSVPLIWDGLNDQGQKTLTNGNYTWKALTSQVTTVNQGTMGDSVYSNQYVEQFGHGTPDASFAMRNVAVDSSGNLYQISAPTENGNSLQEFSQDGLLLKRFTPGGDGMGVTTDGTYLYTAVLNSSLQTYLYKQDTATGASSILLWLPRFRSTRGLPILDRLGQDRYTILQDRTKFTSFGLAVDSNRLWVTDYRNNTIKIYDKTTGGFLWRTEEQHDHQLAPRPSMLPWALPCSRARRIPPPSGWHTRTTRHRPRGTTRGTSSLSSVLAVETSPTSRRAIRSPRAWTTRTAFLTAVPTTTYSSALGGAGQIKEYDVTSTPSLFGTIGTKQTGGAVTDSSFTFLYYAGIAVDSSGILNVVDDHRIQAVYTTTGGGHNAGDLKQSLYGIFGGYPVQTFGYTNDGHFLLVQGPDTYEVDPEWTGGPRAGWLGDGSWRLVQRDVLIGVEDNGVYFHETLMDGVTPRQYRYQIGS